MKFNRDNVSAVTVRQIEPGSIIVGEQTINENVVLIREEIQRGWDFQDLSRVTEKDLDFVLRRNPELVVYGTGWRPQQPARELMFAMARRGIGLEVMDTPAACRTFNILVNEGREVAAILVICE